ncbi:MAG: hypothetical protein ABIK73_01375 [candidate division WOR-3 bacterium]
MPTRVSTTPLMAVMNHKNPERGYGWCKYQSKRNLNLTRKGVKTWILGLVFDSGNVTPNIPQRKEGKRKWITF